ASPPRSGGMSALVVAIVSALLLWVAPAATAQSAEPSPTPFQYVGSVALTPSAGVAGTNITLSGTGFTPGAELDIDWTTVTGQWVLEGDANEEFHGRAFDPIVMPVGSTVAAADGTITATFVAPVDHGFNHDVTVSTGGQLLNKAGFRLEPTVTISPESGPVGTPITIRMEGVGCANLENSWLVTYDNQFVGVLTSVTSGGVGEAVIPAVGPEGQHHIRVVHGAFTVPYLNTQQSPRPDRSVYDLDFEITAGDAVMPAAAEAQGLPVEAAAAPAGDGPAIWADVASGIVGTPVNVRGRGLRAGAELAMAWSTVVGNRVGGQGWDEAVTEVARVTVAEDGTFELPWAIPDDLGGPHRLVALDGDAPVAETSLTITPSIISATTAQGPYGSTIEIHLKGVGWTETANIYNVTYDNAYLGYSCGFNSQGDVTITLPAVGSPGWHFIDLYPGIYKGEDAPGVQNFRIPQLTFAADHPGERLPAFHVAYEVTAEG
ncbi:MAG TPA: hypothetical protein VJZ50_05595, partial [Candidatus Limnocylindrales bacterium]|nr:hypothetical protein [Candidatus Limnocylindrales bacterium]